MVGKKKILVVCGTSIATAVVVAKAIEEALRKRGIQADIQQCQASEVPNLCQGCDLVVTTTPVSINPEVPVIQSLAFLTNIGKKEVLDKIVAKLSEE